MTCGEFSKNVYGHVFMHRVMVRAHVKSLKTVKEYRRGFSE
jgi:hypothetical protein